MRKIINGQINKVSFVYDSAMSSNLFSIFLDKVVGNKTYTFSGLSDPDGIDSCREFVVLDIDLTSTDVDGGEYYLTLSNATDDIITVMCEAVDYEYANTVSGNELYSSTVKINNL